MSELGDSYDYADSYLDQDDLSDEESESIDSKVIDLESNMFFPFLSCAQKLKYCFVSFLP